VVISLLSFPFTYIERKCSDFSAVRLKLSFSWLVPYEFWLMFIISCSGNVAFKFYLESQKLKNFFIFTNKFG